MNNPSLTTTYSSGTPIWLAWLFHKMQEIVYIKEKLSLKFQSPQLHCSNNARKNVSKKKVATSPSFYWSPSSNLTYSNAFDMMLMVSWLSSNV
jgi:hypothetical protein